MSRITVICGAVLAAAVPCLMSGCDSDGPTGGGGPVFNDSLPFAIQIEKTHGTVQGFHELVEVHLNNSPYHLTGLDFTLIFDTWGLQFQEAFPSDSSMGAGWESFEYEFSQNEGDSRALVHVRAITDGRSEWPPTVDSAGDPVVLFSLDILVSEDRGLEAYYAPIRFYWEDCDDNTITFRPNDGSDGEVVTMTKRIIDFDLIGDISDDSTGFPTYTGYQRECTQSGQQVTGSPVRMLDLYNGGVDIYGCPDWTPLGDVNLNDEPYEIADLVLFTRYFSEGLAVLGSGNHCMIDATNVNRDYYPLTASDWVYFIRTVVGGAKPLDSLVSDSAVCSIDEGILAIDKTVQAAQMVIEGDAHWELQHWSLEALSYFDGFETRVLVHRPSVWEADSSEWDTFTGPFFWTDGTVRKMDASTIDGARVDVTIVEE